MQQNVGVVWPKRADWQPRLAKALHMLAAPKLRWRTAFSVALIILALMVGLAFFQAFRVRQWYRAQTTAAWQIQATRLAMQPALLTAWREHQHQAIPATQVELVRLVAEWATLLNIDLTLVDHQGVVQTSTLTTIKQRRNLATLPEMAQALAGYTATQVRDDETAAHSYLWVATPLTVAGRVSGALHLRVPISDTVQIGPLGGKLLLPPVLLVAALIIAMLIFQAEQAASTLRRLATVAERIAGGDLSARTLPLRGGEVGQFARAFNRMADKLQKQMAKRAREKDRLNTVLHVMTDGVLILNRHGGVRLLNPAAAKILKTTPERALKRSFVQAVRDHRFVEVFQRCQQTGQGESAILELDGERFMRMIVTPFLKGSDHGHLVVVQDLTRLHQLQTMRRDFISNISHELRTPLASLRALVDTLNDGALDDPVAAQRFLKHMEVEVDALTQMVQELLDLSRIESGNAVLQLAAVPAATVIAHGAERLRTQAERAELDLQIALDEALPNVHVDVGRIEQVITNLIHNAIKFTPTGGVITVSALARENSTVMVKVADTGVGIAYEDQPRIFERFFKADRARSGGGTGLGLAIAKHIVQAHGGRIWVDSKPGRGSAFYFTLPIANHALTIDN